MIDEQSAPPGTKVKCVDDSSSAQGYLVVGMEYEVESWRDPGLSNSDVYVKGVGPSWAPARFILSRPAVVSTTTSIFTGVTLGGAPVFSNALIPPGGGFLLSDFDLGDLNTPPLGTKVPSCLECERELCAELDAYWGPHPFMADYCTKCRRKHEPHGANAMQGRD